MRISDLGWVCCVWGFLVAPAGAGAEPMTVTPVLIRAPVKGIPISIAGQSSISVETHSDHADLAVRFVAPLDDVERQSAALAQALGLNIDECHGLPVSIHVESGELRPAAPNLSLILHGKVQGWLCKPFKTHLTPELEVTAQTTISLHMSADHLVTVVPSNTHFDVKGLDNLGAAGGVIKQVIAGLENKVQAELAAELGKHDFALEKLASPFAITAAETEFSGKALVVSLSGSLAANDAATLASKLINGAIAK